MKYTIVLLLSGLALGVNASDKVQSAIEAAKQKTQDVAARADQAVRSGAQKTANAANRAVDATAQAARDAQNKSQQAYNDVKDTVQNAKDRVASDLQEMKNSAAGKINEFARDAGASAPVQNTLAAEPVKTFAESTAYHYVFNNYGRQLLGLALLLGALFFAFRYWNRRKDDHNHDHTKHNGRY
ncbi:hypothetical protein J120_00900 [candidate division TM6 bacterium JCVI TM6SC1]|jgi:gas vesicle protein|uniref:Uncharacterized protein n=1 Tax=candidate division TM6 bacterium JCVI TM6SC1 TaxID=1306947 RepID=A0A0D2JEM6_9BACT|nr:hypothetical protein J120_00900 [candidate division TM6 bacterium JCVI TM6SC1]